MVCTLYALMFSVCSCITVLCDRSSSFSRAVFTLDADSWPAPVCEQDMTIYVHSAVSLTYPHQCDNCNVEMSVPMVPSLRLVLVINTSGLYIQNGGAETAI